MLGFLHYSGGGTTVYKYYKEINGVAVSEKIIGDITGQEILGNIKPQNIVATITGDIIGNINSNNLIDNNCTCLA